MSVSYAGFLEIDSKFLTIFLCRDTRGYSVIFRKMLVNFLSNSLYFNLIILLDWGGGVRMGGLETLTVTSSDEVTISLKSSYLVKDVSARSPFFASSNVVSGSRSVYLCKCVLSEFIPVL